VFDPFGFNAAIQTNHLTDEQMDEIGEMLDRAEARRG
jgi:hypothetical protein